MSKLIPLSDNVKKIFTECISNIRDSTLKKEYKMCENEIINDTNEYEKCMQNSNIHTMQIKESVMNITKEQMIKIYDNKFSKIGQPGRKYYEKIISLPKYGMCPYCGIGSVSTLDHYMPKTKYITLVVSPQNLIPSCADCNKKKLDVCFNSEEETFINPYYFDLHDIIWLEACFIPEEDDFNVIFKVSKEGIDFILYKRLKSFFSLLKLNSLYISHASQELTGLKMRLVNIYKSYGKNEVKKFIKDTITDTLYDYPLNHWKKVLYMALLSNEWFLEEWIFHLK